MAHLQSSMRLTMIYKQKIKSKSLYRKKIDIQELFVKWAEIQFWYNFTLDNQAVWSPQVCCISHTNDTLPCSIFLQTWKLQTDIAKFSDAIDTERILLRRSNLNAGFTVHILMIIIPFTSTSTSTLIFFNAITHQEELKEKKV